MMAPWGVVVAPEETTRHAASVQRRLVQARQSLIAGWTWSSGQPLPPELRNSAARRIGTLGLLTMVTLLGFAALNVLSGARETELPNVGHIAPIIGAVVLALVFSVAIFAVSRWRRDDPLQILALSVPYQILMAAVIGVCEHGVPCAGDVLEVRWSGVAVWIIIFAVFVPNTPIRTLYSASVAALMDPLTLLAMVLLRDHPVPDATQIVMLFGPTGLAVATAVVAAAITFRLGSQVHDARQMGSYRLVELLGKGGMGEVWRAEHEMLARPAAIKLIQLDALARGSDPDNLVLRFEREAHATALLQSEHTIELYDFGIADDGTFYYVMELLDGLDLDEIVQRHGPMPPARVVHCLAQVCDSLAEAHEQGLIHRDIKPSNIYLCRRGLRFDVAKVLDFGLVKAQSDFVDRSGDLTTEGTLRGTPAFMVPEIAQGAADIDGRADIYALGCVAWWLLTGGLVFEADNPLMMVANHLNSEPPQLSKRAQQPVPPALEALIHECLHKDPQQRPVSAAEVARRLTAVPLEQAWDPEAAQAWWQTRGQEGAHAPGDLQGTTAVFDAASDLDT
jgi:eukaryotic-like serine/threonine-protein kinase